MVLRIQGAILAIAIIGCAEKPRPYPWNFPPAEEWNQPMETSWVNAVDMYRRFTIPKSKAYHPDLSENQQDLVYESELMKVLPRDIEEDEMYR